MADPLDAGVEGQWPSHLPPVQVGRLPCFDGGPSQGRSVELGVSRACLATSVILVQGWVWRVCCVWCAVSGAASVSYWPRPRSHICGSRSSLVVLLKLGTFAFLLLLSFVCLSGVLDFLEGLKTICLCVALVGLVL